MAYSSHVAQRDVSARPGVTPRTMFAGCAAAALTAGAIYGVSQYIDMGGGLDRAPAAARVAEAPGASSPSLFDPRLSLGVGGGFVAAPRPKAPAPLAANRPEPARAPSVAAKPAPLPDAVEEVEIPLPAARPAAPEVAAVEPEVFVPAPPRRPDDLVPVAPAPRLAARPAIAPPAAQASRLAPPTVSAPAGRADHLERLTGGERLTARAEPAPQRARARILSRRASVVARAQREEPSFFQKLFGGLQQPTGALAYAPTSRLANDAISAGASASAAASARRSYASLGSTSGARGSSDAVSPRLGGGRAIYDISSQVVVLPDGTRLEAHSGLGPNRDNIRSAHLRMRGVTPPHVYNLREREALFHGVRAIRLTPVGGAGAIHNRNGLLAHTYMLGPNGDSNGCVSIRDYNAFLSAYLQGKITQLVVVESMRDLSSQFALR